MKLDTINKKIILGIYLAVVLALAIFVMIKIWSPKKVPKDIYRYFERENLENDIAQMYGREIRTLLIDTNSADLFKKLDKTYLAKENLNESNFKEYLKNNLMIGQYPIVSDYEVQKQGDNNIFRYKFRVYGLTRYVNLIETFPYEYTLSFDQDVIPVEKKYHANITKNNIKFEIDEIERNDYNIKFNIKITNVNNNKVEVEFNNINTIILNMQSNETVKMSALIAGGNKTSIAKNETVNKEVSYNVAFKDQGFVKSMIFNDVVINDKKDDIIVNF